MSEKRTNSGYPVTDFRNLTSPIVDVRSPSEFSQGHWPGAINIPLFSDTEREAIGKSYKRESRLKAILIGLKVTLPNTSKLLEIMQTLLVTEVPDPIPLICLMSGDPIIFNKH